MLVVAVVVVYILDNLIQLAFQDTGLPWLDDAKLGAVGLHSLGRGRLQLPPQLQPPFACATSRGFLRAAGYGWLLLQLGLLLFALIMLPTTLAVAAAYENEDLHVLVTAGCFASPLALLAAVLHHPAAWLLRRQRTPLQDACLEYLKSLRCLKALPKIEPSESGAVERDHPKNQGLALSIVLEFWEHFERFILQRNMHYVVGNVVIPLTARSQTSFVALWGGRAVDFFVSHSWGTSFQHFVQCLRHHASSASSALSALSAPDAAYWICSFANNQWDVAADLGDHIMDSAFARVLQSGVRGVVMVLDQQVQPLTRGLTRK